MLRREVAKWAAFAGSSFGSSAAAAQNSQSNIRWFSGLTDAPVTYFDVIEPTGGRTGNPGRSGGEPGRDTRMPADRGEAVDHVAVR